MPSICLSNSHGGLRNLCVVGDDDQSTRVAGANISNILDFEKDFPEAKVIKLEQEPGSTKTSGCANEVVRNNRGRQGPLD